MCRCFQCCCLCTYYNDVLEKQGTLLEHKFTVKTNLCCCGDLRPKVNNCCGATCCNNDLIMDVSS